MARVGGNESASTRPPMLGLDDASHAYHDMDTGADSREERRLMRLRGAGNREFNNIDFGFAFATPVQVSTRKPLSRTKTPSLRARTPVRDRNSEIRIPSSRDRSSRKAGLPFTVAQDSDTLVTSQNQRKRRRLSDISNISRSSHAFLPALNDDNLDGPNSSRSRDATPISATAYDQIYENTLDNVSSSPLFFSNPLSGNFDADKENRSSKITIKKRKRKSIGQQSLFKKKQRRSAASTMSSRATPTVDAITEREPLEVNRRDSRLASVDVVGQADGDFSRVRQSATQPDETSLKSNAKGHSRKKKRKSITGVKKKRRSDEAIGRKQRISTPMGEEQQDNDPVDTTRRPPEQDLGIDNDGPNRKLTMRRRPPFSPVSDAAPILGDGARDEEDADETYLPDEATPEPTPAPKRAKVKIAARQRSSSGYGNRNSGVSTRHNKYPILTHRMTNLGALPTITEGVALGISRDDDNEDKVDELASNPPAILMKAAPSAVDVLAQACRETIDASIEDLKKLPAADRSRQVGALQTLRANLDMRLFDLSQSLDQRLHLEARLRKQRREKAELQARWLEIRKQRDVMALRMDAARRLHWDNENLSRQAWNISQSANRLETAMSRAETQADEDPKAALLEFSLQELSQVVSSKSGGGILNVLKKFNAQLERTARVSN